MDERFVEEVPRARAAAATRREGHFQTEHFGLLESLSPFRTSWLVNTIKNRVYHIHPDLNCASIVRTQQQTTHDPIITPL